MRADVPHGCVTARKEIGSRVQLANGSDTPERALYPSDIVMSNCVTSLDGGGPTSVRIRSGIPFAFVAAPHAGRTSDVGINRKQRVSACRQHILYFVVDAFIDIQCLALCMDAWMLQGGLYAHAMIDAVEKRVEKRCRNPEAAGSRHAAHRPALAECCHERSEIGWHPSRRDRVRSPRLRIEPLHGIAEVNSSSRHLYQ